MMFKYYYEPRSKLVYRTNRKNNTIEFYVDTHSMWSESRLYVIIDDVVSDKNLQKIEKAELVLMI